MNLPSVGSYLRVIEGYLGHQQCGFWQGAIVRVSAVPYPKDKYPIVFVSCPGCGGQIGCSFPSPFRYHYAPVSALEALAKEAP